MSALDGPIDCPNVDICWKKSYLKGVFLSLRGTYQVGGSSPYRDMRTEKTVEHWE